LPGGPFTTVTYRTLAWKNLNGLAVPQQFQAVQYAIGSVRDQGLLKAVFDGTATSVITVKDAGFDLEIPPVTRVSEKRYGLSNKPGEFIYNTTDGSLWSRKELQKHPDFFKPFDSQDSAEMFIIRK
jgi:hypothetical protein